MILQTNKRLRLGMRVGINLLYLLLAIAGTYGIVLLNPSLMAWYYMLGQFAVPGIALLIATVLAVLTVFTFRIIKEFAYFKPLLIATYPVTLVIVTVIMNGGLSNPLNINDYFYHLAYQKQDLEEAQRGDYDAEQVVIPLELEDQYAKQDLFIFKAVQSQTQPRLEWVHLLKPSVINGADDYLALYDEKKQDLIGIRATDDIWQEIKNKYHLNVKRSYEHVSFEGLKENQILFGVNRPVVEDYKIVLGTDGTHVVIEDVKTQ